MTIYDDLRTAGCEISHHASDLYTPVTETSQRIIGRHHRATPVSVGTFIDNTTGRLSFDIAFAYDPFWPEAAL